jgi:hypothetical protein
MKLTPRATIGAKPNPTSTLAPRRAALDLVVVGLEVGVVAPEIDWVVVTDDRALEELCVELADVDVDERLGAVMVSSAAYSPDEL